MKKIIKRKIIYLILALGLVLSLLPETGLGKVPVHAANYIGSVTVGEKKTEYEKYSDLAAKVSELEDKKFTIDMYADWGNERLYICDKAKVTLNMNGHMINRNLSEYCRGGEVIYLGSEVDLTINGGPDNITHSVSIYDGSTEYSKVKRFSAKIKGGVIAGGFSSTGSGGIDIYGGGCTLTLNNVTIAGCRAAQTWGMDGYGGGIWVHGSINNAGTVKMNNSVITGCYATNDGGGIYQNNHNHFTLNMNNSRIENNWCGGSGGGIHIRGEKISIEGNGNSKIANNHSGKNGGGIYIWNDDTSVSGFSVTGNEAGGNGGGIYTLEEDIGLSGLEVKENSAGKYGGGIYIYNDENKLANVTVTKNNARKRGGGIYVESDVDADFHIMGRTVIRDNSRIGTADNLTIKDKSTYVNFNLGSGSDVYMGYEKLPDNWALVTQGKGTDGKGVNTNFVKSPNCVRYLHAEDSGWEFRFNSDQRYRKIFYVRKNGSDLENTGKAYTLKQTQNVDPIAEGTRDTGKTVAGASGKSYPLTYGFFRSSDADGKFFYSDGFFDSDPFVYNEHLASLSMVMAMTGCYLNEGGVGRKGDYSNKHAAGRQFMADIGCDDQRIYINDFNFMRPGMDSIGVTIASKTIETQNDSLILIPIVVRSAGYEKEWASNVTVGTGITTEGESQGFSEAASGVMDALETYISKYNLKEAVNKGKAVFWISGYSRGGATANLAAKRIRETWHDAKLFAYTFATPKGGSSRAMKLPDEDYFCIHNTINPADLVPYAVMMYMGFVHYGVDHYAPGSKAGNVKKREIKLRYGASGNANKLEKIVTYCDNDPYLTKSDEYYAVRDDKMLPHLEALDPDYVWDDYYHTARISYNPVHYLLGGDAIIESGDYKERAEDLLDKLFLILETDVIESRDVYAEMKRTYGIVDVNTYQKALRDTMVILYNMENSESARMMDKLANISNCLSAIQLSELKLEYLEALGNWHSVSAQSKANLFNMAWRIIKKTGILDDVGGDDRNNLQYDMPALLDIVFRLLDADVDEKHIINNDNNLRILGSLAYNLPRIMNNHLLQVNLAWIRAADSYYDQETTAWHLNRKLGLSAPSAVGSSAPKKEIPAGNVGNPAEFKLSETILLDVPEIKGEAIYYDLENLTDKGVQPVRNKIYRGGIDLPENDRYHPYTDYRITAYAKHYNDTSKKVSFDVRIIGNMHMVTIDYSAYPNIKDFENVTNFFKEGDAAVVLARNPAGLEFKSWTVLDDRGRDVTSLLGDTFSSKIGKFTMPMPEEGGFSKLYSLTFKPVYEPRIDSVHVSLSAPVYGRELRQTAEIEFRQGTKTLGTASVPVVWTMDYPQSKLDVITNHPAYHSTVYTAHLRIDCPDSHLFGKNVTAELAGAEKVQCSTPKSGDHVYINAVFPKTETGSDWPDKFKTLTVQTWDINLDQPATDYHGYSRDTTWYIDPNSSGISVTAPALDDEEFYSWDALESGFSISKDASGKATLILDQLPEADVSLIRANYIPVIREMQLIAQVPQAARAPEPDNYKVYVTVSNKYMVSTENLSFEWSPKLPVSSDKEQFDYDTVYTLTVKPEADAEGKISLLDSNGKKKQSAGLFKYADDLVIDVIPVNEFMETLNQGGEITDCVFDPGQSTVSVTFKKTAQKKIVLSYITWPKDILDVPYKDLNTIETLLPAELEGGLADGSTIGIPVKWTLEKTEGPKDGSGLSVWTWRGSITQPELFRNRPGIAFSNTVNITVGGAAHAEAPTPDVDPGTYLYDLSVCFRELTAGGEIRYTTDGTDPMSKGLKYTGKPIEISRSDADAEGIVTLRAVTIQEGYQPSAETVSQYRFTRRVDVPETAQVKEDDVNTKEASDGLQIIDGIIASQFFDNSLQIIATASSFYTLTGGEGVTIDSEGNALAKGPGVYSITAKIADGYEWAVTDPETGLESGTKKDQTFSVAIGKASVESAKIHFGEGRIDPETGLQILEITGISIGDVMLDPKTDYDVTYIKTEHVAVITGKGNYTGTNRVGLEVGGNAGPNLGQEKTSVKNVFAGLARTKMVYTGSALEPAVKFKKTLKRNKDYTVSYKNNRNVGTATVTVKGKGDYTGTVKATFRIIPKPTKITKTSSAAKAFTVKWKARKKQTTGYQIQYSASRKFKSGKKTVTVTPNTKTSKRITKLKAKKIYYVRVRTYKTTGKKNYYSKWSKAKAVKTK